MQEQTSTGGSEPGRLAEIEMNTRRVGPPMVADAERVAQLFNACATAQGADWSISAAGLRRTWQSPGFDPAGDAWLLQSPQGMALGYAEVWHNARSAEQQNTLSIQARGCVHPDHRGQGIGTQLTRLVRARAEAIAASVAPGLRAVLRNEIDGADRAARRLLELEGYRPLPHVARLLLEVDLTLPAPQWPRRIAVWRHIGSQDDHIVYEAMHDAALPPPPETWPDRVTPVTQNESPLWLLALDGTQIAAGVLVSPDASHNAGWISRLFVRPQWREAGLGQALVQHACEELLRRGTRQVGLVLDRQQLPCEGNRLEDCGLHVRRQYLTYEQVLRN